MPNIVRSNDYNSTQFEENFQRCLTNFIGLYAKNIKKIIFPAVS